MALSAGLVWQAQNGGSDTNPGGFRGGANLAAPAAPTVAATSGGSVGAATYYVVVTFNDGNGETQKSPETSVVISGGNLTITVTAPANPGTAMTWAVYVATATGGPYWNQGTGLVIGTNRVITSTPPTSGVQAPGVDYSLAAGAQVTVNNTTITASSAGANSNVITFVGYAPTSADVGNTFFPTAGANVNLSAPYEIIAWTSTTWTVQGAANFSTAGGAASAIVGKMGGALASPALGTKYMDSAVNGNTLFIKYNASAYSCSNSTQAANGALLLATRSGNIIGYDTNRTIYNTDANRPILNCTSASFTPVSLSVAGCYVANLAVTNTGANAGINGISVLSASRAYNCTVDACDYGFRFAGGGWQSGSRLYASNCTTSGGYQLTATVNLTDCGANGCKISFDCNGMTGYLERCIAVNMVNVAGAVGFGTMASLVTARNCVAYNNLRTGQPGFQLAGALLENCIAYGTLGTASGFDNTASNILGRLINCAGGSNGTGGNYDPTHWASGAVINFVALTGDPFTSGVGNDFSLNNTAGAGAACRAVGTGSQVGTQIPGLSTASYPDLGVSQTSVSGGGGGSSSHNLVL